MKRFISQFPRDFILFLLAGAAIAFAQSLINTVFNNFLNDRFILNSLQRTFLEIPRELPGVLVIFVSALFFFMDNRGLAAVSQLFSAAGILLFGLFSKEYSSMVIWLFILSLGQHLFLPLTSDIGMELAHEKKAGKRLGQLQGASNIAAIIGSFVIFLGFKFLHMTFLITFIISAVFFLLGGLIIARMKKNKPIHFSTKFKFRKKYKLYYLLTILYGTRKQIFLTFAPWILVTVFMMKTQGIATLLTIGGIIGIFFNPLLGHAIDKYGEKAIIAGEAVALIFVCIGYGFARKLFPMGIALLVASSCYVIDQLLMSVSMARATYLKKIAVDPAEVTSTLTAGVSLDHLFSITIALTGGIIWKLVGYEYIFLLGGCIALLNLVVALKIKALPESEIPPSGNQVIP